MIFLTRLDGREVVVNDDLIVTVERTPDTVVALTTGDRILVRESVEDVVDRTILFRHRVVIGPGPQSLAASTTPVFAERSLQPTLAPAAAQPGQVSSHSTDVKG